MVYVADSTGFVPINQIRARPGGSTTSSQRLPLAPASAATSSGTGSAVGLGLATGLQASASDVPEYRAPVETWDRDYRRLRSNTTRVQRKYPQIVSLHGIKGFVITTKSFVKIGITKIFCYNNKTFSSINKTFGCCSEIFGCSYKKIICCPQFCYRNKNIFSRVYN